MADGSGREFGSSLVGAATFARDSPIASHGHNLNALIRADTFTSNRTSPSPPKCISPPVQDHPARADDDPLLVCDVTSQATRPTRGHDCNREAKAGFAAAHG